LTSLKHRAGEGNPPLLPYNLTLEVTGSFIHSLVHS
jgi:hypothetical protein